LALQNESVNIIYAFVLSDIVVANSALPGAVYTERFKSTIGQIKLIKQMQSQLKQLQNQLTQIQKIITKKDLAIKTPRLRKKTINANRSRKKT